MAMQGMVSKKKGEGGGLEGHAKAGTLPSASVAAGPALPDVQPFRDKLKEFVCKLVTVDNQGQGHGSTDGRKAKSEASSKAQKRGQAATSSTRTEMREFITATNDLLSEIDTLGRDCSEEGEVEFIRLVVHSLNEAKPGEMGMITGIATILQQTPDDDEDCEVLKKTLDLIALSSLAQTDMHELGEVVSSFGRYLKRLAGQQRNAKSYVQSHAQAIILPAAQQDKLLQKLLNMGSIEVVELFNGLCVWLTECTAYEQSLWSEAPKEDGVIPGQELVKIRNDIGDAIEVLFQALRKNDFIMDCQGDRNSWPTVKYSTMLVTVLETKDFKREAARCLAKLGLLFEVFIEVIKESASSARDAMNDILINSSDAMWNLLTIQSVEDEEFATASMVIPYTLILSLSETVYMRHVNSNMELSRKHINITLAVLISLVGNMCNWRTSRLQFIAAFLLDMLLRNFVLSNDHVKHHPSIKRQLALTMSFASDGLLRRRDINCRTMGGRLTTTLCRSCEGMFREMREDQALNVLSQMSKTLKNLPMLSCIEPGPLRHLPNDLSLLNEVVQWDQVLNTLNKKALRMGMQEDHSLARQSSNIMNCIQSLLDGAKCKISKAVVLDLAEAVQQFLKPELFQKQERVKDLESFSMLPKVHKLWQDACESFRTSGGALSKHDQECMKASLNNGVVLLLQSSHDLPYGAWFIVLKTICSCDQHECAIFSFAVDQIRMLKPSLCDGPGQNFTGQEPIDLWGDKVMALLKIGSSRQGLVSAYKDQTTEDFVLVLEAFTDNIKGYGVEICKDHGKVLLKQVVQRTTALLDQFLRFYAAFEQDVSSEILMTEQPAPSHDRSTVEKLIVEETIDKVRMTCTHQIAA